LDMAIDPSGRPVIAVVNGNPYVKRWADTGWLDLKNVPVSTSYLSMAVTSDDIYVAVADGSHPSYVYHRSGNAWQVLGNYFFYGASNVRMAVYNDTIYVAYSNGYNQITVARYNRTAQDWTTLGGGMVTVWARGEFRLLIDKNGVPYVSVLEAINNSCCSITPKIAKLKNGAWVDVAGTVPVDSASYLSMDLSPSGSPIIAFNRKAVDGGLAFLAVADSAWAPSPKATFPGAVVQSMFLVVDPSTGIPYAFYGEKRTSGLLTPKLVKLSFDP
jgi:hypothetical protein